MATMESVVSKAPMESTNACPNTTWAVQQPHAQKRHKRAQKVASSKSHNLLTVDAWQCDTDLDAVMRTIDTKHTLLHSFVLSIVVLVPS